MLFRRPERILEAQCSEDVPKVFASAEKMLERGFHLAGYIAYEAAAALEPALLDIPLVAPQGEPFLWLGCYRAPQVREQAYSADSLFPVIPPMSLELSLAQGDYQRQVETVRELVAAGETYQANLTMTASWEATEAPAELYDRLVHVQPVPYAALLHPTADWHILSLSPELFFRREGDHILTRPMKGTAAPGLDAAEQCAQAEWLRSSEKNRAENVMIVDLLRSDLGRICRTGSVRVTSLFEIESYPTVLQMTSTVEGMLRENVSCKEIFSALFPSGSIVGAPKFHTMRLLHGLERRPRGIYTGAIGYLAPQQEAEFNVAIRTVSLRDGKAVMGVGSGITWDSDPALEYAECLSKTAFLTREPEPPFELIETLLLQGGEFTFLEEHLERMAMSARYFGFAFDRLKIRSTLQHAAQSAPEHECTRVRLLLNRSGQTTCTTFKLACEEDEHLALLLWDERTKAGDRFLRHKTTHRALYEQAFRQAQRWGFNDCLFFNTDQEVTEGAIHNVVVSIAGRWFTPPLRCGVLPGVYRRHLLQEGKLIEQVLHLGDLLDAEAIFVCNSVRGLRRVRQLARTEPKHGSPVPVWSDAHSEQSAS